MSHVSEVRTATINTHWQ